MFRYTPEVLAQLATHGLAPTPQTDPRVVRAYLSLIYRFEIRRLKRALLGGAFPAGEYVDRVRALRRRYVLLSIPVEIWVEAGARGPGP